MDASNGLGGAEPASTHASGEEVAPTGSLQAPAVEDSESDSEDTQTSVRQEQTDSVDPQSPSIPPESIPPEFEEHQNPALRGVLNPAWNTPLLTSVLAVDEHNVLATDCEEFFDVEVQWD